MNIDKLVDIDAEERLRELCARPRWDLREIADLMIELDLQEVGSDLPHDYRATAPLRQSGPTRHTKTSCYVNFLYFGRTWRLSVLPQFSFALRDRRAN